MNDILKIRDGETENEALWRIAKAKNDGLLGNITWPEIAEVMNKAFREDETCYYDSSAYRKRVRNYIEAYEKKADKLLGNKKFWISLLVNLFMVTASCYALNWLHPRVNKYFDDRQAEKKANAKQKVEVK